MNEQRCVVGHGVPQSAALRSACLLLGQEKRLAFQVEQRRASSIRPFQRGVGEVAVMNAFLPYEPRPGACLEDSEVPSRCAREGRVCVL